VSGSRPNQIFARIARRYDRINTILTLGRERSWRRRAAADLPSGRIIDLGSGTGAYPEIFDGSDAVAVDPVMEMLRLNPLPNRVAAVGEGLPFAGGVFDGAFSAFVIRNLTSVEATLGELDRVLRPGSRAVVVDLTRPRGRLTRFLHRFGTAMVLPVVGLLFAGAPREYWYLHRSLDDLPPPEVMFATGPLHLERVTRMGLFGFVYAAVLIKP